MTALYESETISVSIERSPKDVYEFVSNPANLPLWAAGLGTSVNNVGGEWVVQGHQGPMKLRFAGTNDLGVLDHCVQPAPEEEICMPMRVVPNGEGSEFIFTLFRLPGMSYEKFQQDAEWVQRDLNTLKRRLEMKTG